MLQAVVVCEPHGECGDPEAGLDWGVETFATLAYGPGEYDAFVNDRLLNTEQEALRIERRQLSHALQAKRSRRALEARRTLAKPHRKVANRRKYHIHQVTAKLVRRHGLIVTVSNGAILDTATGLFVTVLCVKAEEAGCKVILLDTRRHRSSRTCPSRARVRKKSLSERGHQCGCGFAAARDQAAALLMRVDGLKLSGREPAWAARLELNPEPPKRPLDGSSS
jgi:putative transposase